MSDDPPPPALQSNDIMAREPQVYESKVKHILIGWRDLADAYGGKSEMDPRAAGRSRAQADELVKQIYDRAQAGEPFEPLMMEFSEDPGSAKTAQAYEVTQQASLVTEFKQMGLRLQVDEIGVVLTTYGWHIMKRVK